MATINFENPPKTSIAAIIRYHRVTSTITTIVVPRWNLERLMGFRDAIESAYR